MAPSDTGPPTTVVIVEDHDLVALGLAALLDDVAGIEVVGSASTSADALARVTVLAPDVVLMDYRLPDGTGAATAREVKRIKPSTNIIMITSVADRRVLAEALDAGCCGFLSKNGDRADLVEAIAAAAAGDSYFTRDVLRHLVHLRRFDEVDHGELSDREVEVLQLTADGLYPDDVAHRLHLSVHTVKNHLRHVARGARCALAGQVERVVGRLLELDGRRALRRGRIHAGRCIRSCRSSTSSEATVYSTCPTATNVPIGPMTARDPTAVSGRCTGSPISRSTSHRNRRPNSRSRRRSTVRSRRPSRSCANSTASSKPISRPPARPPALRCANG